MSKFSNDPNDAIVDPPVTDEPKGWVEKHDLSIKWENLFTIRLWLLASIGAGAMAWLASKLWEPMGVVVFCISLPVWIIGGMFGTDLSPRNCPHCGKRVKAGFDVCHHCGREY